MALKSQHEAPNQENFEEFFIKWKDEQSNQLQELTSASKTSLPLSKDSSISLSGLVKRVTTHYEDYYRVKSKWAQGNIFLILSQPWNTPLKDAFLWIGGWRPSTAFHLLYSVSGLQLEAKITELMNWVKTGDLADLSLAQLGNKDALQRIAILEEKEITEDMAKQQEKVADVEMVELSHEVSESIRVQRLSDCMKADRVDSTLKPFKEGFKRILQSADDLRLRTLEGVIGILSPIQGVHFLIAAAELHLRVHDLGEEEQEKNAAKHQTTGEEAS